MPPKKRDSRPTPVLHANLLLVEVAEPWLLDRLATMGVRDEDMEEDDPAEEEPDREDDEREDKTEE